MSITISSSIFRIACANQIIEVLDVEESWIGLLNPTYARLAGPARNMLSEIERDFGYGG